ncbi:hypothetical protein SALBM135S_08594 [Streptomyces alboniger]
MLGGPTATNAPAAYEFCRNGEVWRATYEGRTVHMPDAKGLRDLHCLLSLPGQDIAAVRLLNRIDDAVATVHGMGADEVLDDEARSRYRRHLERLDEEIDRAVEQGDEQRAAASRRPEVSDRGGRNPARTGVVGIGYGRRRLAGGFAGWVARSSQVLPGWCCQRWCTPPALFATSSNRPSRLRRACTK